MRETMKKEEGRRRDKKSSSRSKKSRGSMGDKKHTKKSHRGGRSRSRSASRSSSRSSSRSRSADSSMSGSDEEDNMFMAPQGYRYDGGLEYGATEEMAMASEASMSGVGCGYHPGHGTTAGGAQDAMQYFGEEEGDRAVFDNSASRPHKEIMKDVTEQLFEQGLVVEHAQYVVRVDASSFEREAPRLYAELGADRDTKIPKHFSESGVFETELVPVHATNREHLAAMREGVMPAVVVVGAYLSNVSNKLGLAHAVSLPEIKFPVFQDKAKVPLRALVPEHASHDPMWMGARDVALHRSELYQALGTDDPLDVIEQWAGSRNHRKIKKPFHKIDPNTDIGERVMNLISYLRDRGLQYGELDMAESKQYPGVYIAGQNFIKRVIKILKKGDTVVSENVRLSKLKLAVRPFGDVPSVEIGEKTKSIYQEMPGLRKWGIFPWHLRNTEEAPANPNKRRVFSAILNVAYAVPMTNRGNGTVVASM
jgi:hypothetical protein